MPTRDASYTVLGGSMMTALGLSAIVTSNYLNSSQLDTGTFLRLWTSTILVLALGFVLIVGGFLMATNGRMRRVTGGILGVLASLVGAFMTLILVTTTAGISPQFESAQLGIALEILYIGSMITLFLGFPLSMFGTVSAIVERQPESGTSEIPS